MSLKRININLLVFGLTAILFCSLISLRPIPKIDNANDTGRYIQAFHQFCAGSEITQAIDKELSFVIFHWVTSPACLINSDRLFLFETAVFLPLIFLLFVAWGKATYFWACSLMFSVTGLELMTNAFRQGFATLLFFGAISLIKRHKYTAIFMVFLAAIAHSSVVYYIPLFAWFMYPIKFNKLFAILIGVLLSFYAVSVIFSIEVLSQLMAFINLYKTFYSEELNLSFIIFISLPIFWIYGVQYYCGKGGILIQEKAALFYTVTLLLFCYFLFPAILYRFAIFGVALQIFLAAQLKKSSRLASGYVLIGSLLHLCIFLFTSKNYQL